MEYIHDAESLRSRSARWMWFAFLSGCTASISAGCDHPFGDENAQQRAFEIVVENDSDVPIFLVTSAPGGSERVRGEPIGVSAGKDYRFEVGLRNVGEPKGGCLDDFQMWLISSRSGINYINEDDYANRPDDIEVLAYYPPDTCTDGPELRITWPA